MRQLGAVEHSIGPLGPLLQAPRRLLDVTRLDGRFALAGRVEQGSLVLALLGGAVVLGAVEGAGRVFLLLDFQGNLGEGLDHLEGEEAEDVDNVVGGLAVRHDAEAGPLAEALALAVREGRLAVLRPGDVLFARHGLCALVGLAEALERDVVHFLFFFVVLVVALGHLDVVEGGGFPGEADFGLFVLLGGLVVARGPFNGFFAAGQVGVGTLVVRVFDVFAHVFPREKGAEAGDLGLVVTDLEDEVVDADGL